MCGTCGCGHTLTKPSQHKAAKGAVQYRSTTQTETRRVRVERDLLAENDGQAAANRTRFAAHNILALNLVSSPGSGKTALLVKTLQLLKEKFPYQPVRPEPVEGREAQKQVVRHAHHERPPFIAVIEGDQQTSNDAKRIRATGVAAIQINTGKGCHLDAQMVAGALDELPPLNNGLLFIENVGNLVCPAAFDLGEAAKVAVLSVTEGEDKPLKYPDMFRAAKLMLLNKCDLLPHLDFDIQLAEDYARRVNPGIEIIRISAKSGAGMEEWLAWLERMHVKIEC